MRAQFLAQKVWGQMFKRKMDSEMKQHAQTEAAFVRMRACAGNSDVKEMVSKFLSREQTYTSLLASVNDYELKFELAKQDNEEKKEQLRKLCLENDNKKELGYVHPNAVDRALAYELKEVIDDSQQEVEYTRLGNEIDGLRVHMEQLQNRKKNIQLIHDQVGGWTARVGKKIADQLDDHTLVNKNATLL